MFHKCDSFETCTVYDFELCGTCEIQECGTVLEFLNWQLFFETLDRSSNMAPEYEWFNSSWKLCPKNSAPRIMKTMY